MGKSPQAHCSHIASPEIVGVSHVFHTDETGWRVDGKTHWLWCFSTPTLTYFMIDRSRGSPALVQFFTEEFAGVLVTDFWGAYKAVPCALRQTCLVHLLRDLETVEKYKFSGEDWRMRRLLVNLPTNWRIASSAGANRCTRVKCYQKIEHLFYLFYLVSSISCLY